LAWRLAEWQLTVFNYFVMGLPKAGDAVTARLGPHRVSARQHHYFETLVADNMRFCRLGSKSSDFGSGRGLHTLRQLIEQFEQLVAVENHSFHNACTLDNMAASALPVKTDRIAVCNPAGTVHPEDILDEPERTAFLDYNGRTRDWTEAEDVPRSCYLVSREEEDKLRRVLLDSGMAVLLPEAEIPTGPKGQLLLSGLFGVKHKTLHDRLIFDRRPANALDRRLAWARLPLGPQLCRVILRRGEGIRGSGDDLRTYFYCLRNSEQALPRNAFGRRLTGDQWQAYGGTPGVNYRLALRVVAMGDTNAVDIAHVTHHCALRKAGCLQEGTELIYGNIMPPQELIEGLYIDDHFAISVMERALLQAPSGPDRDIIMKSHRAYESCYMPRAPEKGYGFSAQVEKGAPEPVGAQHFRTLGTDVDSDPGLAAAPLQKRIDLFLLSASVDAEPFVEMNILRRTLSLYTHPYMHRRELMAVFGRCYRWMKSLTPGYPVRWAPDVRDELAMAAFLLPLAEAHLRWEPSQRITATDATVECGGTAAAYVSSGLASFLFRFTEHRGCRVALTTQDHEIDHELLPAFAEITEITGAKQWHTTRSRKFHTSRHINLQEIEEVHRETRERVSCSMVPEKGLNAVDNNVCLGAKAKGRSGSHAINASLRVGLAWQVYGRKPGYNFRLPTHDNPGDDPSRRVPIRKARASPQGLRELLQQEPPSQIGYLVAALAKEWPVPGGRRIENDSGSLHDVSRVVLVPKDLTFGDPLVVMAECLTTHGHRFLPVIHDFRAINRDVSDDISSYPRRGEEFRSLEEVLAHCYELLIVDVRGSSRAITAWRQTLQLTAALAAAQQQANGGVILIVSQSNIENLMKYMNMMNVMYKFQQFHSKTLGPGLTFLKMFLGRAHHVVR